ncbi:tetratricopeptide repeat protein [Streptomyces sp. NPDC002845]
MNDPTYAAPVMPNSAPDEVRAHDPMAVALGNASLLGVGYLMLRRRRLALAAVAGTAVLVSRLVATASSSYEVAVLLWWAAVVAHGWFLARGGGGRGTVRGRRLVALGITLPVLLAVGLTRFDASRIGRSVTEARESGDCARVSSAQDRVWFGHRIADAPLTARGDEAVEACDRLQTARTGLTTALTGDTDALEDGFGTLASVLAEPGNEKTVEATLNGFLGSLPAKDPCDTVAVTDWLRDRKRSHDVLDRSADTAARTAPAALVGCGEELMADSRWKDARTHYEQLLDQYPGDDLAGKARKGARKATLSIELAGVRSLLTERTDAQPEYCSSPAKYSGAKPLGKGTNRALFYPDGEYDIDHSEKLPGSWKADGPTDAVLVVCMGETRFGSSVETCPYRDRDSGSLVSVTFYKVAIPVKVYELRTGKLVANRTIQINGTSCPAVITYYTYGDVAPSATRGEYVEESKSDVKSAFRPLVVR